MTCDEIKAKFPHASAAFIRKNAVDGAYLVPEKMITGVVRKKPAKRIRQNSTPLNKTEQAFLDYLNREGFGWRVLILVQSMTLKLGNGVRYTPDFVTVANFSLNLTAYEVKGYMRDDAAVKLKVAAAQYPWIAFKLVTRRKDGGWDIEAVLP